MIISPPFLSAARSAIDDQMKTADGGNTIVPENDVCAANMQECAPGNGAYPVSFSLGWHGGAHLVAPKDAHNKPEPVRAIADGVVVYVHRTAPDGTPAFHYRNVRTDDDCVVIQHTTEIGEVEDAKGSVFSICIYL